MKRLCLHCQLAACGNADFCCLGCELAHDIQQEASHDLAGTKSRVTFAALLCMLVMMLSLFLYAEDVYVASEADGFGWLRQGYRVGALFLSAPILWMLGVPLARSAWARLRRGYLTLELLIAIAAAAAFVLSARSTLRADGAVYFDTAAAALLLATVGRYLEARVRVQAAQALAPLASGPADKLLAGPCREELRSYDPAEIEVGWLVQLSPQQPCPVDMVALSAGQLDLSAINGEPKPQPVTAGDAVMAGAVPIDEPILGRATSSLRTSTLRRTEELTKALAAGRGKLARLADRLAAALVPIVATVAVLTLLYWTRQRSLGIGLEHALAVLLVACPCTYGVVTPLVFWMALERSSARGIAIRDAAVIERLAAVRHVAFDKTGTLTRPLVPRLSWHTAELAEGKLWELAAALEQGARHPLAAVMREAAAERRSTLAEPARQHITLTDPSQRVGAGVAGRDAAGQLWRLGSARWLASEGVSVPPDHHPSDELHALLALNDRHVATFAMAEQLRGAAPLAVAALVDLGVGVSIASGDPSTATDRVAQVLGIRGRSGLSAAEKANELMRLPRPLAAVGDGDNDGPWMAAADVSVAVAGAVSVARGVADVVLLHVDLDALPWLFVLARRARSVVKRALIVATGYNVIFVAMAAAGLLRPIWAGLSMLISSLLTLLAVIASIRGEQPAPTAVATAIDDVAPLSVTPLTTPSSSAQVQA